jgi:hypothetical protein
MNAPSQPESTALSLAARPQFDLSPQTFEQALTFADYLAASEMVPKVYRGRPGDCLIAMQWGFEVGLKPLQALQSIATINGKPGLYGDAGKAILLANGCIIEEDDIAIVEKNGRARCKITRPGRPPVERTFSVDNAKTANLWNKEGPWRSYPWRQMAWRAFWFAARDAASDLLRGLPGFEEVIDVAAREEQPQVKHMGAAEVVQPPAPAADTRPPFPADDFDKGLSVWRKAAAKLPVAEVLARAEAANPDFAFTEQQKATILSLKKDEPTATFAQVADALTKAKTADALATARDLIRQVSEDQQRKELEALADEREAALTVEG